MPIHNGQPVDEISTNPAFIDAQVDSTGYGRVTLSSTTTDSGPSVSNLQAAHNASFQDLKLFICTEDHSKVRYQGGQIFFTADILIVSKDYGVIDRVSSALSPINIADGESWYLTLQRLTSATILPQVTSILPKGRDIFRIATRIGAAVVFWDNTLIRDGSSGRFGDVTANLTLAPEVPTYVSSGPLTFTITQSPVSGTQFWVYIDGVKVPQTKISLVGQTFTLDSSVEWTPDMDIECISLVEAGPTPSGGSGGGGLVAYGSTLTPVTVTPASSMPIGANQRQIRFLATASGAQNMTGTPQIFPGTTMGQELILVGTSDTNYPIFSDGNGLSINGSMSLKKDSSLWLVWNGVNWSEISRR
jgi:hypothetical protein